MVGGGRLPALAILGLPLSNAAQDAWDDDLAVVPASSDSLRRTSPRFAHPFLRFSSWAGRLKKASRRRRRRPRSRMRYDPEIVSVNSSSVISQDGDWLMPLHEMEVYSLLYEL